MLSALTPTINRVAGRLAGWLVVYAEFSPNIICSQKSLNQTKRCRCCWLLSVRPLLQNTRAIRLYKLRSPINHVHKGNAKMTINSSLFALRAFSIRPRLWNLVEIFSFSRSLSQRLASHFDRYSVVYMRT